ncbi:MAG TPA: hypothetical protein VGG80_07575 [Acidobacteriaceae bacterium]|jgi:hypothetical protein
MDVANVVVDPRLLHSTSAIPVANGVIGNTNGTAGDTRLVSVLILATATTGTTLTIAGFKGEDGTARSILLTGQVATDTLYTFPGLKNSGGAMTLTASNADKVLVAVTGG